MYTLYTDKNKQFSCNVDISGASLKESRARMIVESEDVNLVFNGKIYDTGICEIDIKKLHNIIAENTRGNVKLEIIAENTLFTPWESEFIVKTDKKVSISEIKDVVKQSADNEKRSILKEDEKKVNVSVKVNEDIPKKSKTVKKRSSVLNEHVGKLKSVLSNNSLKKKMTEAKIVASYQKLNKLSDKEINYIKNKIK